MKQQPYEMVDQRTQFVQKWLTSATCHQSNQTQQFLNTLFHLLQTDVIAEKIFTKNMRCLFLSHQANLDFIFQFCLKKNNKLYNKQICMFLVDYLDQKNQISLSAGLEIYLIHNIWRDQMQQYVETCKFSPIKIIQYLSLKMRSLNSQIRYQAIKALQQIVQLVIKGWQSKIQKLIQQILPQMIQKQNYGKSVCYYRGVLLQILQDQFCHIKKKGIQILGKSQSFLDPTMLRPLILYMLNDEHQAVRQTCLLVLSQIPSLDIEKQDLSALLVCLKQNNTVMRSYTYQNLSHINITSALDFKIIMERLFSILVTRSQDKKKIYILCCKLGKKYPAFVLANLQNIYKFTDNEEPNWKSLQYRARFITISAIGVDKWPKSLPKYFNNHYLYIRDVLLYAFQTKPQNNKSLSEMNQQVNQHQIFSTQISINLQTQWQVYHFIKATECITQGLLKSILTLIMKWIKQTKLSRFTSQLLVQSMLEKIQKFSVMYNIASIPICTEILQQLEQTIKSNDISLLRQLCYKMNKKQTWYCLQQIQPIIFKVSSIDKQKIVISNIPDILKRSFIQFSNPSISSGISTINANSSSNSNAHKSLNQVGYLRMSQVDFQQVNNKICYYKMGLKYKNIRCFIIYGHPHKQYVTHVSNVSSEGWLDKIVV